MEIDNVKNSVEDVKHAFPEDEFEMTLYAFLPRLRPGESITLQDFKEKKTLNGSRGKCVDHDGGLHVWTILFEDGKKMRVVPKNLQKAMMNPDDNKGGKPVLGFIAYGTDIVEVVLDTTNAVLQRHVKEHVIREPSPPRMRSPSPEQIRRHSGSQTSSQTGLSHFHVHCG